MAKQEYQKLAMENKTLKQHIELYNNSNNENNNSSCCSSKYSRCSYRNYNDKGNTNKNNQNSNNQIIKKKIAANRHNTKVKLKMKISIRMMIMPIVSFDE